MNYSVECIDTEAGFFELQAEWDELLSRSSHATIFMTFEWAQVCWNYRGSDTTPFILKVYHDSTLVGLVPLRVQTALGRPTVLQHIGMGFPDRCLADYLDVLAAIGYEERVLREALAFLKRQPRRWDTLDWWQLPEASPSYATAVSIAREAGFQVLVSQQSVCHTITLPASIEEFVAGLSANIRSTVERKVRKIQREHQAVFEQVQSVEQLAQALQALIAFQKQRWDIRDTETHATFGVFGQQMAARMLERGSLDLRVLRVEHAVIAVIWCFRYHGTVYYYLSAFDQDPQWSKYSIGTILLVESMKQAIVDGYHTFDLMRGDYAYKTRFASNAHLNYRLRIVHSSRMYWYYRTIDVLRDLKRSAQRTIAWARGLRGRNTERRLASVPATAPATHG